MLESKANYSESGIPVQWKEMDIYGAALLLRLGEITFEEFLNLPQNRISKISEQAIREFCRNCDQLSLDGICELGFQDQIRYVARGWCGWAQVEGVRVQMIREGIKPWS